MKTMWFCTSCGADSPKWVGKCPACGAWNTMVEEKVGPATPSASVPLSAKGRSKPRPVNEIEAVDEPRIHMPSEELNRVLGGGLVKGSIVLIGGEPGIGKSTLVLQNLLSIRNRRILYVSGEESATQLKLRADRIGRGSDNLYIVCETSLENIFAHIEEVEPEILVVDSIQTIATETLDSSAGSVGQVRECAACLLRFAKESGVPVLLIGHINKEGTIAGPKVLEHIVDAVLQFEGDRQYMYRLLRGIKNRFGSTSEIGIYEMVQRGLREVANPSEMLMGHGGEELSGVAVGVTLEGIRLRQQACQHAACRARKARRLQARGKRCVPQRCRRHQGQRPGPRPGRDCRHIVEQCRHGYSARMVHGRRSGAYRRNTPRDTH